MLLPEVPAHLRPAFTRARAQVARLLRRREAARARRRQTALLARLRGGHDVLPAGDDSDSDGDASSGSSADASGDDDSAGATTTITDASSGARAVSASKQAASKGPSKGLTHGLLVLRLLLAGMVVEYVWTVGEVLMMPSPICCGSLTRRSASSFSPSSAVGQTTARATGVVGGPSSSSLC
jgi:hypothetical protein